MDLTRFGTLERIGEGTYGVVYKGVEIKSRKAFALKMITLDRDSEGVPSTCIREISLLKELNHNNIVKLYDVVHVDMRLYLVFEFIDGDLKDLLDKLENKILHEDYVKSFVYQLLQALAYCHTHRVIHRDLKPQNILVDRSGIIKLADFGLARCISLPSRVYTHEVVTLWYRAPEVLLGTRFYSTAIDMWSLACILREMACGKPLFDGDSEIDQLFHIFRVLGTPNSQTWPGVEKLHEYNVDFPLWAGGRHLLESKLSSHLDDDGCDFVHHILTYVPERRMTAKAALSHRYLRQVPLNLPPLSRILPLSK